MANAMKDVGGAPGISIPYSEIADEFMCSLCLEEITDCHTTECGHNFCEECIMESLNRRHACPLCQKETTQDRLVKNYSFDNLLQKISAARERAANQYVSQMVHKARENHNLDAAHVDSPIEQLFQKHIKSSLLEYEQYYQDLHAKYEKKKTEIRASYALKRDRLRAKVKIVQQKESLFNPAQEGAPPPPALQKSPSSEDAIARLEELTIVMEDEVASLQSDFEHAVNLLVESYDSYMKQVAPSPFLLPVSVKIRLQGKALFFNVKLRATDKISDCRQIISDKLTELGDPLVTFGEDSAFSIRRPFGGGVGGEGGADDNGNAMDVAGDDGFERLKFSRQIFDQETTCKRMLTWEVQVNGTASAEVKDESRTVHDLKITPGTEIKLLGGFRCKSDAPAVCFTAVFNKDDAEQKMDYFKCKTCGFNWICKSCASICHKACEVVPYIMNHKPSYACCYCVKKRKCTIENIKTKKRKL